MIDTYPGDSAHSDDMCYGGLVVAQKPHATHANLGKLC
jgi:hypothetical protein